ncbi:MAG TPA: hypothetical protein ENN14_00705 [Chloroflexi bacterium]|nr:hypothetical protein [Chloroflexota bacterium]
MKTKTWLQATLLAILFVTWATPALAMQGGGGVHFGPYTLASGNYLSGDLVVFGPVTIEANATLAGDLVGFGPVTIEEEALIEGDVAVFGFGDVAGVIEGSLVAAGALRLRETARITGDVSAAGEINAAEGAIIEGSLTPFDSSSSFSWDFPFAGPIVIEPSDGWNRGPTLLWKMGRAFLMITVMSIFALIISAIWPQQLERVGRTLVDAPALSFGMGLLSLLIAAIVIGILFITICLSPIGFIGAILVGLAIALGWVALGYILGEPILKGLLKQSHPTPVLSALVGTLVITTMAQLVSIISGCLNTVLVFPFFALVAGAVMLTRFGTVPYATRGVGAPVAPPPVPPREPRAPSAPILPGALPFEPEPEAVEPEAETGEQELPSPHGE